VPERTRFCVCHSLLAYVCSTFSNHSAAGWYFAAFEYGLTEWQLRCFAVLPFYDFRGLFGFSNSKMLIGVNKGRINMCLMLI
jgi:hypothetical protein